MYKYLFLICFGIIIFILLNQIDTFNISSQFVVKFSNIEGRRFVPCQAGLFNCREELDSLESPCSFNSINLILNLLGIRLNTEQVDELRDIIMDDNPRRRSPLKNFGSDEVLRKALSFIYKNTNHEKKIPGYRNVGVTYIPTIINSDNDLLSLEKNRLYLATIDMLLDVEEMVDGEITMSPGHVFLLYRRHDWGFFSDGFLKQSFCAIEVRCDQTINIQEFPLTLRPLIKYNIEEFFIRNWRINSYNINHIIIKIFKYPKRQSRLCASQLFS